MEECSRVGQADSVERPLLTEVSQGTELSLEREVSQDFDRLYPQPLVHEAGTRCEEIRIAKEMLLGQFGLFDVVFPTARAFAGRVVDHWRKSV